MVRNELCYPFCLKYMCAYVLSCFGCVRLCVDPVVCRLPGSSVHEIPQARILEWVAMPFSRGSSRPRIEPVSLALQADSLPPEPPGKPKNIGVVAYPFSRGSSRPRIELVSPTLQVDSLPTELSGKHKM